MSAPPLPPLPDTGDELHGPFWEGTRAGELRVQVCRGCGRHQWPPRWRCPRCGGDLAWEALPPRGRLFSWLVAHHPFVPAFAERVPYTVGIVELDGVDGVRVLGNVVETPPEDLEPGMALEGVFEAVTAEVTLVNWRRPGG